MILVKFFKLRYEEKIITIESLFLLTASVVLVRGFKLKKYSKLIGEFMGQKSGLTRDFDEIKVQNIICLFYKTQRYFPVRTTCLENSIALKRLLNKRNIKSSLILGVKKENEGLKAHAWIDLEDRCQNNVFKKIACFS